MILGQTYTYFSDNNSAIKYIAIMLSIMLFVSGYVQHLLTNTCILGYLLFTTMKFLKTNSSDPTDLLKHWSCFSFLITFEYFFSLVFGGLLMTFLYNVVKVIGLIMLLQDNQNLLLMYDICLTPLYNKYEQQIDQLFIILEDNANNFRTTNKITPNQYNIGSYINPYIEILFSLVGIKSHNN